MKTIVRLFKLLKEPSGTIRESDYDEYVYRQWETEHTPIPRVGDYIYTNHNGCETAEVNRVVYSMPESEEDYIMVDLYVTIHEDMFND